jgi:hypothetical protein
MEDAASAQLPNKQTDDKPWFYSVG